MADQEHLDILRQGVAVWNTWREEYPEIQPQLNGASLNGIDLSEVNLNGTHITHSYFGGTKFIRANLNGVTMIGSTLNDADLSDASLSEANFSGVNFTQANLFRANLTRTYLVRSIFRGANLCEANLHEAQLSGAEFHFANLSGATVTNANLSSAILTNAWLNTSDLRNANLGGSYLVNASLVKADLSGARLIGANFSDADLSDADLNRANLSRAILVGTNLTRANLTNCFVHGISCWDVELEETKQLNLVITPSGQPTIKVDNLEVAQFIYLLLNNQKIHDVIDTIGQKGVLILGRFSDERKFVLDALREKLRMLNFLPIVFDFERSVERDFTETIMTLAGLSCFIIADITNPKSSPLELQATVPNYMIPFIPIIQEGEQPFSMFQDLKGKYDWVLDILKYDTPSNLINGLERAVVKPALEMRDVLLSKKMEQLRTRHIGDYL